MMGGDREAICWWVQLQPLADDLHIVSGIIDGRGGVGILLYIRREGWLSHCGDHGCGEPMRYVGHGVERQHNGRGLCPPTP